MLNPNARSNIPLGLVRRNVASMKPETNPVKYRLSSQAIVPLIFQTH